MVIEALAETNRQPWTLEQIRIRADQPAKPAPSGSDSRPTRTRSVRMMA
jgi:hypothetical protein